MTLRELPRTSTRHAELHLALACLMIGLGGLLLGLQVDGNGDLVGTGFTALGVGALVALAASLVQAGVAGRLPTDWLAGFSAACGFVGMSVCVAGVLAPGGAWMFAEVLLLFWLLARRRKRIQPGGPERSTILAGYAMSSGAATKNRTPDLLITSELLYQLSYGG